jgi:hypothetical protein
LPQLYAEFAGLGSGIITMTTFSLLDANLERVSVVLNIIARSTL